MAWVSIIAELLKFFGPLLKEWLERWLDDRLSGVAEDLPPAAAFAGEGAARVALIDAALAATPRRQAAKRFLLWRMRSAVVKAKGGLLAFSPEAAGEFRDAAAAAGDE